MTPNQLLPILFKISRKVNLIFDHLELIFPKMSLMKIGLKCDFTIKKVVQKEFMMVDEYDTPK